MIIVHIHIDQIDDQIHIQDDHIHMHKQEPHFCILNSNYNENCNDDNL